MTQAYVPIEVLASQDPRIACPRPYYEIMEVMRVRSPQILSMISTGSEQLTIHGWSQELKKQLDDFRYYVERGLCWPLCGEHALKAICIMTADMQ
jgi:hypothetical protein